MRTAEASSLTPQRTRSATRSAVSRATPSAAESAAPNARQGRKVADEVEAALVATKVVVEEAEDSERALRPSAPAAAFTPTPHEFLLLDFGERVTISSPRFGGL